MSVRGMLRDVCTIRGPSSFSATAASGFAAATEADLTTDVPCLVQAMSSNESRAMGRETGTTTFWVYLLTTATIKTQYRIVPKTGSYNARVLSVIGPPQDEAGHQSHFRVPCELLEGGGSA